MKNKLLFCLLVCISSFLKANDLALLQKLQNARELSIRSKSVQAFELLWQGLAEAKAQKNIRLEGMFYIALADEYLFVNQVDSIDYYYGKAVKIFEKTDSPSDLIKAKLGLLEIPRRTNPSSTMERYLTLLNEARSIQNDEVYHLVQDRIITVNMAMENFEEAIKLSKESLQYYQNIKDVFNTANKLRIIGNLYFQVNEDSCLKYFEKALPLYYSIHSMRAIVLINQTLGWKYVDEDLDKSWQYLSIADSIDRKYHIESAQLPLIMSFALQGKGKTQQAIEKAKECYARGWKAKQLFLAFQSAEALADYYKSIKNIDSAMHYTELYAFIKDSIRSQKQFKDAGRMQAKLEYDKELYQKDIIQQEEVKRQHLINYFTIAAFVLSVIIIFLIYRAYLSSKKNAAIISAKNDEKTMLIKEIHHRVKNNLTVISGILDLQKRNIKDEQMLEIFKDAKSRINSMALVHKNLYEQDDFTSINSQSYFENLYKTVSSAYKLADKNITTIIHCEDVNINIDTLIPLALITNELLTNSFKYAFEGREAGEISLRLRNTGSGFEMKYSDNGIGISKQAPKEGLGSLLIEGLTKQLDGHFEKVSNHQGLYYTIYFKGIHA